MNLANWWWPYSEQKIQGREANEWGRKRRVGAVNVSWVTTGMWRGFMSLGLQICFSGFAGCRRCLFVIGEKKKQSKHTDQHKKMHRNRECWKRRGDTFWITIPCLFTQDELLQMMLMLLPLEIINVLCEICGKVMGQAWRGLTCDTQVIFFCGSSAG